MEYDFSNKVVLVTGASVGIGEAIALFFAKYGAMMAIVGRNEKNLQGVAKRCEEEKGQKALAIVADLGTDEGCEEAAEKTMDYFGKLDVLVNNVGVGARATILTADMETFDRVFAVDVRGVYNLTRLLVPALIITKGNIVNISSIVGKTVSVGSLPYGMAKAALDHFSRLIALELAPKGVRVNTVSPGVAISKFFQRVTGFSDEKCDEMMNVAASMVPMGEACTGDDIARMVVHIASDNSRLVTGTVVQVDGCLQYNYIGSLFKKS